MVKKIKQIIPNFNQIDIIDFASFYDFDILFLELFRQC